MDFSNKNNKFGNRLKHLRLQAGLTQAQLADKLNIASSTVGMYEQGRREPDNAMLTNICNELRVSLDYLLGIKYNDAKNNNQEIDDLILDFIDFLESKNDLMFQGVPLKEENKKIITSALRVATAISITEYVRESDICRNITVKI